jgi:hypothetical protein
LHQSSVNHDYILSCLHEYVDTMALRTMLPVVFLALASLVNAFTPVDMTPFNGRSEAFRACAEFVADPYKLCGEKSIRENYQKSCEVLLAASSYWKPAPTNVPSTCNCDYHNLQTQCLNLACWQPSDVR